MSFSFLNLFSHVNNVCWNFVKENKLVTQKHARSLSSSVFFILSVVIRHTFSTYDLQEMQQCRFTDPHHIIIILFLLLQTRKELDLLWGQDPSSLLQPDRPQMLKAVFLDSSKALSYEASLMALKHTKPTHIWI